MKIGLSGKFSAALLMTAAAKIEKQSKAIDDNPFLIFLVTISLWIYTNLRNNQNGL